MMNRRMQSISNPSNILVGLAICLASFGLLMVYESSAVVSSFRGQFSHQYYFLNRQMLWFFIGIICMLIASHFPTDLLRRLIIPALGFGIVTLMLTLIPGIGFEVGGARRWLRVGSLSCQPAEPVILLFVIYSAHLLSKRLEKIRNFRMSVLPLLTIALLIMTLMILQPKIGSAMIIGLITGVVLFAAGIPFYQLSLLSLSGITALSFLYMRFDYISQRIDGWLNPEAHFHGVAFQPIQSLIAIGSGGISGNGLGNGSQKLFFLPEAHTDFIFAIIAEELGFIGAIIIICIISMFLFAGLKLSINHEDPFRKLLTVGIVAYIFIPAVINIMVSIGLFPVTGIPLPFLSFGGTALVTNLTAVGLLAASVKDQREIP